ncbi:helix-turn-helix domain-containing protein [Parabacteroides sp. PF5-9]|uniref:helix-turn-helix domain-containing protein n=1 Tax=Parabacteroides sp. PF5-9 TaxID=1742404 RepID=UPI0024746B52|nr:helix-turn-helix domain-containing protein [Parabacteroides sp. PF5-9]MDH6358171.1 AraC family transcriptional activator of pobA [Parabacteroides sp. PF5-9]
MNAPSTIKIEDFKRGIEPTDFFEDQLFIVNFDNKVLDEKEIQRKTWLPVRLNAVSFLLVEDGTATIKLDHVPYQLTPNTVLLIMPVHIVQEMVADKDFKGKFLISDFEFIQENRPSKIIASISNYVQLRKNPILSLTQEEISLLMDSLEALRAKFHKSDSYFHQEVVQIAFASFLLDFADIIMSKKEHLSVQKVSRREDIFNNFLKLLLKHCKEQHAVSFYADKLFITSQYLSLALKDVTGKTANEWINEAVLVEAKILLKSPNITIQQIADELNFSDQSTFGKFFKKHVGVSPLEYRRNG